MYLFLKMKLKMKVEINIKENVKAKTKAHKYVLAFLLKFFSQVFEQCKLERFQYNSFNINKLYTKIYHFFLLFMLQLKYGRLFNEHGRFWLIFVYLFCFAFFFQTRASRCTILSILHLLEQSNTPGEISHKYSLE